MGIHFESDPSGSNFFHELTKVFILSVLVACASAQYYPGYYGYNLSPFAYSGLTGYPAYSTYAAYPAYSSSQYHAQDELGQATYGYSYPGQASSTTRDAFGNQIGSYAYFEKDEAAMTPAATTKIDLKEKEHEVLTPLAYHAPLTVQAPLAVRTALVAPAPITTKVLTT